MNLRRDFAWSSVVMKRSNEAQSTEVRWKIQSECRNLHTDILSARCIVDRLRTQSDPLLVSQVTDRDDMKRLVANVVVIAEFVKAVAEVSDQSS
jgi:hypothetical protein